MQVALFVTCLVDLLRPNTGFAAVRLLEQIGADVVIPPSQTCCGQPAFNNGDQDSARAIARQLIATFEPYSHVVVPSGSCGGMIVKHYQSLFAADEKWRPRATSLAQRTRELTSFLVQHRIKEADLPPATGARVAYHDSCSALRELDIHDAPRQLIEQTGATLCALDTAEQCCGFGGTFSIKFPEMSTGIVDRKVQDILASGADTLVSTDLGCLLNIAGRLTRNGSAIRVFHIAEFLAGMTETPLMPVGDGTT
jgi:L-lactate dehydrogenase complex protein LldE